MRITAISSVRNDLLQELVDNGGQGSPLPNHEAIDVAGDATIAPAATVSLDTYTVPASHRARVIGYGGYMQVKATSTILNGYRTFIKFTPNGGSVANLFTRESTIDVLDYVLNFEGYMDFFMGAGDKIELVATNSNVGGSIYASASLMVVEYDAP